MRPGSPATTTNGVRYQTLKDFAERIESVCTYDRYGKDCPSENWLHFGIDKAWETPARNALEDVLTCDDTARNPSKRLVGACPSAFRRPPA